MTWDKRPVAVKRNPVNAVPLRYQTKQRHLQRDEAFSCSSPEVRSDVFKSCHERLVDRIAFWTFYLFGCCSQFLEQTLLAIILGFATSVSKGHSPPVLNDIYWAIQSFSHLLIDLSWFVWCDSWSIFPPDSQINCFTKFPWLKSTDKATLLSDLIW